MADAAACGGDLFGGVQVGGASKAMPLRNLHGMRAPPFEKDTRRVCVALDGAAWAEDAAGASCMECAVCTRSTDERLREHFDALRQQWRDRLWAWRPERAPRHAWPVWAGALHEAPVAPACLPRCIVHAAAACRHAGGLYEQFDGDRSIFWYKRAGAIAAGLKPGQELDDVDRARLALLPAGWQRLRELACAEEGAARVLEEKGELLAAAKRAARALECWRCQRTDAVRRNACRASYIEAMCLWQLYQRGGRGEMYEGHGMRKLPVLLQALRGARLAVELSRTNPVWHSWSVRPPVEGVDGETRDQYNALKSELDEEMKRGENAGPPDEWFEHVPIPAADPAAERRFDRGSPEVAEQYRSREAKVRRELFDVVRTCYPTRFDAELLGPNVGGPPPGAEGQDSARMLQQNILFRLFHYDEVHRQPGPAGWPQQSYYDLIATNDSLLASMLVHEAALRICAEDDPPLRPRRSLHRGDKISVEVSEKRWAAFPPPWLAEPNGKKAILRLQKKLLDLDRQGGLSLEQYPAGTVYQSIANLTGDVLLRRAVDLGYGRSRAEEKIRVYVQEHAHEKDQPTACCNLICSRMHTDEALKKMLGESEPKDMKKQLAELKASRQDVRKQRKGFKTERAKQRSNLRHASTEAREHCHERDENDEAAVAEREQVRQMHGDATGAQGETVAILAKLRRQKAAMSKRKEQLMGAVGRAEHNLGRLGRGELRLEDRRAAVTERVARLRGTLRMPLAAAPGAPPQPGGAAAALRAAARAERGGAFHAAAAEARRRVDEVRDLQRQVSDRHDKLHTRQAEEEQEMERIRAATERDERALADKQAGIDAIAATIQLKRHESARRERERNECQQRLKAAQFSVMETTKRLRETKEKLERARALKEYYPSCTACGNQNAGAQQAHHLVMPCNHLALCGDCAQDPLLYAFCGVEECGEITTGETLEVKDYNLAAAIATAEEEGTDVFC